MQPCGLTDESSEHWLLVPGGRVGVYDFIGWPLHVKLSVLNPDCLLESLDQFKPMCGHDQALR
jgi:hypothetical protein